MKKEEAFIERIVERFMICSETEAGAAIVVLRGSKNESCRE